jgi:hypothetical protein
MILWAYRKLVLHMQKLNTTVNKALFSKLLKQVHDEVLQPSIIVKAFSTCGYTSLDFAASYTYKQVPPPAAAPVEMESWPSSPSLSDSSHASSESSPISFSPPLHMTDPLTPKCRPQCTQLYPVSPELVAGSGRPSGKPNPLGAVRQRIQALIENATSHRLAKVCNEVWEAHYTPQTPSYNTPDMPRVPSTSYCTAPRVLQIKNY